MTYVSVHYLLSVIGKLVSMGVPRHRLLACVPSGEPVLSDPLSRIDSEVLIAVYREASRILNIEDIGLVTGQKFDMSTLNETGKALPSSATLGDAVAVVGRYHRLSQTFAYSKLELTDDLAIMRWHANYSDYEKYRQVTSAIYTGFVSGTKWLLWRQPNIIKWVQFRVSEPEQGAALYEDVYGCAVHFNSDVDALVFSRDCLSIPLATADAEAFDAVTKRLDKMLLAYDEESLMLDQVKASIRLSLNDGAVKASQVASALGVEERSLRYILTKNNTTFRDELDMARKEEAVRLFGRDLNLSQIAYRLGYSDQSAFNRAFRKWFSVNPKDYRKKVKSS